MIDALIIIITGSDVYIKLLISMPTVSAVGCPDGAFSRRALPLPRTWHRSDTGSTMNNSYVRMADPLEIYFSPRQIR